MTDKEFEERFEETWTQISTIDQPFIANNELKSALDLVGFKLPNHQVRELINGLKKEGKIKTEASSISKEVFKEVSHSNFLSEKQNKTPFPFF